MWSLTLFATQFAEAVPEPVPQPSPKDPLQNPEVIWGVVGLALALFVGAAVIYVVDRWRKQAAVSDPDADGAGSLTSYRAMYESGEITEAEYAELRRRVAEKVKKPAPQAGAPAPITLPAQPGERVTTNPPAPPGGAPEPPPPPTTA